MNDNTPERVEFTTVTATLYCTAITALELALEGAVLAIVVRNPEGRLWISPTPEGGRSIMAELAAADWALMKRLTDEHIP